MDLDLATLREMHPTLPCDVALMILGCAALALERNSHKPGVSLSLDLARSLGNVPLSWPAADLDNIDQHDHNRITEDGAEAVALALAHRYRSWRVVRRIQCGGHADWLLADVREDGELEIALEISGVDRGSTAGRLSRKSAQVRKNTDVDQRWVCVVGFEEPTAVFRYIEEVT